VVGAALVLLVAWAGWSIVELRKVQQAAPSVLDALEGAKREVGNRDWEAVRLHADALTREAQSADEAARSLPLRLAARLPLLGPDVRAVQTLTGASVTVANEVVQPLAEAADAALAGGGWGRLDTASLQRLGPAADAALAASTRADDAVAGIDVSALHEPVRTAVADASVQLTELRTVTTELSDTTRLVPTMLGVSAPRTYLLAFQNLAEARATGGIIGSWAEAKVAGGKLRLVGSGTNNELGHLDARRLAVDDEARALWGEDLARSQNFNLTPHFPRAARLLTQLWEASGHPAVDGVVSIDPIVLQEVLAATGPLDVPGGPRLTGQNAAEWLMNGVYAEHGGGTEERDAYLQQVTAAVFSRLTGDSGAEVFWDVLQDKQVRRHVMVWSTDPEEQRFVERVGIAGALPHPDGATVGVFTTNADASKLDHYLRRELEVVNDCKAGTTSLRLLVANKAPRTVHPYVGTHLAGRTGADVTTHRLIVSWYLPPGRGVRSLEADGATQQFATGHDRGWSVVTATVEVARGAEVTLDLHLDGATTPVTDVLTQPTERRMKESVTRCPRTGS
jgi:hypothetical protein